MKRVTVVSFIAGSVLLACTTDHSVAPNSDARPPQISAALVDGAHGGNPKFLFLPPMVPPRLVVPSPIFDAGARPVVEICQLGMNGACSSVPPSPFTTAAAPFDPTKVFTNVQVVPRLQFFFVLWRPNWGPAFDATKISRITVKLDATVLGIADVKVVASEDEFGRVWASKQFVPLLRGGVLTIIFRIEQGAVGATQCSSPSQLDCVKVTMQPNPNETRDVVTPSGQAAVSFPPGYFTNPNGVALTIYRVSDAECFSGAAPPQPSPVYGCYSFSTVPPVDNPLGCTASPDQPPNQVDARQCARVELCVTAAPTLLNYTSLHLFRSDPPAPAQELKETAANLVTCAPPPPFLGPSRRDTHGIGDLARAGWRSVLGAMTWIVKPRPLYGATSMVHIGVGGLTCCFSNIGWAFRGISLPN